MNDDETPTEPRSASSASSGPFTFGNPASLAPWANPDLQPRVTEDEYRSLIVGQVETALLDARRLERLQRRYILSTIALTFLASAWAIVTALADRAVLAVVPAVLSAAGVGVLAWSEQQKPLDRAKAHRAYIQVRHRSAPSLRRTCAAIRHA